MALQGLGQGVALLLHMHFQKKQKNKTVVTAELAANLGGVSKWLYPDIKTHLGTALHLFWVWSYKGEKLR